MQPYRPEETGAEEATPEEETETVVAEVEVEVEVEETAETKES